MKILHLFIPVFFPKPYINVDSIKFKWPSLDTEMSAICSLDISTAYTHWIQDQHFHIYYQVYFSHDINLITVKGRIQSFMSVLLKTRMIQHFNELYMKEWTSVEHARDSIYIKQQTSKKMTIHFSSKYLFLFMCMITYLGLLRFWYVNCSIQEILV